MSLAVSKEEVVNLVSFSTLFSELGIDTGRKIRCPLHMESTPSFSYDEEKQVFHCFGCHRRGTVVEFYGQYQYLHFNRSLSLHQTLSELIHLFNLPVELEDESRVDRPRKKKYEKFQVDSDTLAEKRLNLKTNSLKHASFKLKVYQIQDLFLLGTVSAEKALELLEVVDKNGKNKESVT